MSIWNLKMVGRWWLLVALITGLLGLYHGINLVHGVYAGDMRSFKYGHQVTRQKDPVMFCMSIAGSLVQCLLWFGIMAIGLRGYLASAVEARMEQVLADDEAERLRNHPDSQPDPP